MEALKQKILRDATVVGDDVLKVDNFLNHQIDIKFLNEIGKEFRDRFDDVRVDKILTIEASGIAIASIAAQYFDNVPVVFAKKTESKNLDKEVYEASVYSFTKDKEYKIKVSKRYLNEGENILILDDFLARARASLGLIDIIKQAKANPIGVGIVIEKSYQDGRREIEEEGIRLESLAMIDSLKEGKIQFR